MKFPATPGRTFGVLSFASALAMSQGCAPREALSPELLGRLARAEVLDFAYEMSPTCELQSVGGDGEPSATSPWASLPANALAAERVTVLDRRTYAADPGKLARALKVRDGAGATHWLRNVPSSSAAEVDRRWSCAVDASRVATLKPIAATTVRLVPDAPSCAALTPVIGGPDGVTFEPYTVAGRRLLSTAAGPLLGVTLVTSDGEQAITVLGSDLDACFAVTQRRPMPARERAALLGWLGEASASPVPDVDVGSYRQVAGLTDRDCLSEGEGSTQHEECRGAVFAMTTGPQAALGKPIVLYRERIADAVHGYGGRLAPPEDLTGVNVVLRQVQAPNDGTFAGTFAHALLTSLLDPTKQRARHAHGYRLLRAADAGVAVTTNASLDVDVSYAMPKLETVEEGRRQRRAQGKMRSPNPARTRADARVEAARSALRNAEAEAPIYEKLFGRSRPACAAGAPASCDVAGRAALGSRTQKLEERSAALTAAAQAIEATTEQDNVSEVDYRAKVHRRQGEATIQIKLAPTAALAGVPPLAVTRKVPFDAFELEVAADSATGIEAKRGRPPERDEVNAAVANAVLAEIDVLLTTWMRRSTAWSPPDAFDPGSRTQLAFLARYAASGRRVKTVSYLAETRPEKLADRIEYPITVPGDGKRCFVFVAAPLRNGGDVDLALRSRSSRTLVARDRRAGSPAAFVDVCPLAAGEYVIELNSARAVPFAVGMFESTPGVRARDYDEPAQPSDAKPAPDPKPARDPKAAPARSGTR